MAREDYAHWNEDADYMWYHEEGKHIEGPPDDDYFDNSDFETCSWCTRNGLADDLVESIDGAWVCPTCAKDNPEYMPREN